MQQTFDLRFLNNLKQKLNTSNRRSIYINALPGAYLTRLDLADLNVLEKNLAEQFLAELFSKANFQFKITPKAKPDLDADSLKNMQGTLRRLSAMTIENQDHFSEHGIKTFSFGFPIVVRRDHKDPKRIIKAPLFVWSLDIERNLRHVNQWVIRRSEDFAVVNNMVLASHLLNDAGLQVYPIHDQFLEDSIFDKTELLRMVYLQMKQLDPSLAKHASRDYQTILEGDIQRLKSREFIEKLPLSRPVVLWSGVFGLFKSQKESIINDIDVFIQNFDQIQAKIQADQLQLPVDRSNFMKHTFTAVNTDPSQQHLLHALGRGRNLVLQGPPGTGKSQTLTGIIVNVLSNGGRCLVVCEKKTALEVILNNLKGLGLEELVALVEDIYRDRKKVVYSVRERIQKKQKLYKPSRGFVRLLQSCAMHTERLQQFHKKIRKPLTGEDTWSEVVGKCVDSEMDFDRSLLDPYLKINQFRFTLEELEDILETLGEGRPLFEILGTLNHPFNAFEDHYFEQLSVHQTKQSIQKVIEGMLKAVGDAQNHLWAYLYEYEKLLEEHYMEVYRQKYTLSEDLIDAILDGFKTSKYFFNKSGGLGRRVLGTFSKYKKLQLEKEHVLKQFLNLQKKHKQYNYFKYTFIDPSEKTFCFEKLLENTKKYKDQLGMWYADIAPVIQQYVSNFSLDHLHPFADFRLKAREITHNLDLFAENYAKKNLFKVAFIFSSKRIRKRQENLEQLAENLEKIKEELGDFKAYHALKYFWLHLSKAEQIVFQAMTEVKPPDWKLAFKSWYYHALLLKHEDGNIPKESNYHLLKDNLKEDMDQLKQQLIVHILKYWRSTQTQMVESFHAEKAPLKVSSLYNKRGNTGGRRNSLRRIIETDTTLFSSFFPVLLLSPSVCSSILPLQPNIFDLIIFDEASQLRLEDTFAALIRGRYKVMSGDSQQMPPSDYFQSAKVLVHGEEEIPSDEEINLEDVSLINETMDFLASSESLLEYTLASGTYKEEFLEVHYRSKHPQLIDFSNAAFYGNRLSPMPAIKPYRPIQFLEVGGVYEQYTNKVEAKRVIALLLELAEEKDCPSVGVGTFNIHQRNLILEEIQNLAAQDNRIADQFHGLFQAGLFVKNLENIQGDERTILIISTTFGIRPDGSFLQNFGPINRERGYRLLNVLVTRAKEKLYLITSIPANYYERYRSEIQRNGNMGKGILYAYLVYAKAVSCGEEHSREAMLKFLYEHCQQKTLFTDFDTMEVNRFEEQVFAFLVQKLGKERLVLNYRLGGFTIPIVVKNAEGKVEIAIYFDVFHERDSEESYVWDRFREEHLDRLGLKILRVWSHQWWNNQKGEKNRILKYLSKD